MNFSKEIKTEICKIDNLSINEKKSFLRAIFLTSGCIVNTEKSYHIEISAKDKNISDAISIALKSLDISAKKSLKNKKHIFYIKNSESISNFLPIIGANSSLLDFINIKILKEIRSNANRITNCETSNMTKIVIASSNQIEKIKKFGIKNLPKKFQEVANLRLKNPEISLSEIASMCNPVKTKSNVNYIINQIMKL